MGKGWGWWVGWPTKAKNIINVCTNYNWFGIFVCWNFQHFALNQTRISLGFLSAEMFSIFFQTKLDLVWNQFASKFDTIIFQPKLDLVWKSSPIIWGFFPKPNWIWFGNGHIMKCSCTALHCEMSNIRKSQIFSHFKSGDVKSQTPGKDLPFSASTLSNYWNSQILSNYWNSQRQRRNLILD